MSNKGKNKRKKRVKKNKMDPNRVQAVKEVLRTVQKLELGTLGIGVLNSRVCPEGFNACGQSVVDFYVGI